MAAEDGYISCHRGLECITYRGICTEGLVMKRMGGGDGVLKGWEERSIYTGSFQPLECARLSFQGYYEALPEKRRFLNF